MGVSVVSQRCQLFYMSSHVIMDRMLAVLGSEWGSSKGDTLWDAVPRGGATRAALREVTLREGAPVHFFLVVHTSVTSALKTSKAHQQGFPLASRRSGGLLPLLPRLSLVCV